MAVRRARWAARPAGQSARLRIIPRGLSGGATLTRDRGAERTAAEPGTRAATTAFLSCGRPAARVTGATPAGRPARPQQPEQRAVAAPGQPAMRRDGARADDRARARAPWRRPPWSRARGDAAGARGAAALADPAPRVNSAWPRARALARRPSGATRATPSCRRRTRRAVRAGAGRGGGRRRRGSVAPCSRPSRGFARCAAPAAPLTTACARRAGRRAATAAGWLRCRAVGDGERRREDRAGATPSFRAPR
jgi:hypothetical protein